MGHQFACFIPPFTSPRRIELRKTVDFFFVPEHVELKNYLLEPKSYLTCTCAFPMLYFKLLAQGYIYIYIYIYMETKF